MSIDAPAVAACDWSPTDQVPAPPPASWIRTSSALLAAPASTFTSGNESETGSVKTRGSAAPGSATRPPPSSVTGASCVRPVSAQAGPAVETSADLTSGGVQPGWSWSRSAAAPATCGVAIEVPSNTANRDALVFGSVDDRICPPGAETSGFKACPNAVGPADEKLVITPLRPVSSSSGSWPTRMLVCPPVAAIAARRWSPSRFAIIPPGITICTGIPFASPWRLSERMIPTAPAALAWSAFVTNGQRPRSASTIFPSSEFAGSVPFVDVRSEPAPQRWRSTGLPSVPTIEPASTSVWFCEPHDPGAAIPSAPMNGIPWRMSGAPGAVTSSAGEKTCVFETAATEIASGAVPGDPAEPVPKSSRSLPAAITGTTPAAATLWIASISASFAGSTCGPPPEKLITSMPSATAASNAAMISGVFATWPIGVGTVNTR